MNDFSHKDFVLRINIDKNQKLRAKNKEQRTKNKEQRTKNKEPRTKTFNIKVCLVPLSV